MPDGFPSSDGKAEISTLQDRWIRNAFSIVCQLAIHPA